MTLRELAIEALAVQDACNLSGVAQRFAGVMIDLGPHTSGTRERNRHPIAQLWSDKIASLAGTQFADAVDIGRAYDAVDILAKGAL